MDQPENDLQDAPGSADLREQCEDLRRQVNLLFAGLIVASFTLTLYLVLEAKHAAREWASIQPREEQMLKTLDQDTAVAEGIYATLSDFAKTHPDFQNRIFYKFKSSSTNAPAGAPKK